MYHHHDQIPSFLHIVNLFGCKSSGRNQKLQAVFCERFASYRPEDIIKGADALFMTTGEINRFPRMDLLIGEISRLGFKPVKKKSFQWCGQCKHGLLYYTFTLKRALQVQGRDLYPAGFQEVRSVRCDCESGEQYPGLPCKRNMVADDIWYVEPGEPVLDEEECQRLEKIGRRIMEGDEPILKTVPEAYVPDIEPEPVYDEDERIPF